MKHFRLLLGAGALLFTAIACSADDEPASSSGDDPDASTSSSGGPTTGRPGAGSSSSSGGSAASNAPACTDSEQCPTWYCECASGPPVNTRHCTNGRCEDAPTACPASCRSFDTCWTGAAGGGWDGGSNAGPDECTAASSSSSGDAGATGSTGCGDDTSFADIGKVCSGNAQCASAQCWGVSPSYACTKRCDDEGQCPSGWKCIDTKQGFNVCMQGSLGSSDSTRPVSDNESCAQVTFTDLGGGCTYASNCQTNICLGTYCSKRCEHASDCPSGWSCTTGSSFKYCTK